MSILFYYDSLNLGGQQTQNLNIVKELSKYHEIHFIYNNGDDLRSEFEKHCSLYRTSVIIAPNDYWKNPIQMLKLIFLIRNYIIKNNIKTVFSGNALGAYICGLASIGLKTTKYWYVGGQISQVNNKLIKYFSLIQFDKFINGYITWPAAMDELIAIGASANKYIETKNAVDTNHFRPNEQKRKLIRKTLNIKNDSLVIGWIGRVALNMQVWNTLELFKKLKQKGYENVYFLCVGGGKDFQILEKKVEQYNLGKFVILTNWIEYNVIPDYVNAMDIVPLLEADPHGGSILREAMSCGKIAISVDGVSKTQSLFMKPSNSVLVKYNNYIEEAANWIMNNAKNANLITNLSINARNYAVSEMSFNKMAKIFSDLSTEKY